ncbi:hypothetical protein ACMFMF_010320 [Clarireedia jacksonii]
MPKHAADADGTNSTRWGAADTEELVKRYFNGQSGTTRRTVKGIQTQMNIQDDKVKKQESREAEKHREEQGVGILWNSLPLNERVKFVGNFRVLYEPAYMSLERYMTDYYPHMDPKFLRKAYESLDSKQKDELVGQYDPVMHGFIPAKTLTDPWRAVNLNDPAVIPIVYAIVHKGYDSGMSDFELCKEYVWKYNIALNTKQMKIFVNALDKDIKSGKKKEPAPVNLDNLQWGGKVKKYPYWNEETLKYLKNIGENELASTFRRSWKLARPFRFADCEVSDATLAQKYDAWRNGKLQALINPDMQGAQKEADRVAAKEQADRKQAEEKERKKEEKAKANEQRAGAAGKSAKPAKSSSVRTKSPSGQPKRTKEVADISNDRTSSGSKKSRAKSPVRTPAKEKGTALSGSSSQGAKEPATNTSEAAQEYNSGSETDSLYGMSGDEQRPRTSRHRRQPDNHHHGNLPSRPSPSVQASARSSSSSRRSISRDAATREPTTSTPTDRRPAESPPRNNQGVATSSQNMGTKSYREKASERHQRITAANKAMKDAETPQDRERKQEAALRKMQQEIKQENLAWNERLEREKEERRANEEEERQRRKRRAGEEGGHSKK